jgi:hypothetical protein
MSAGHHKTSHAATTWTVTAVAAAAVYVLSIGPVVGLVANGTIPKSEIPMLENLYWPVVQLSRIPATSTLYRSYVDWWMETLEKP